MRTLVGRDEELRLVREVVSRTRPGRGAIMLVEGEAGIGKTRLIEHLIGEAHGTGMTVPSRRRP